MGPGGVEGTWVWPRENRTAENHKYGDLYDGGSWVVNRVGWPRGGYPGTDMMAWGGRLGRVVKSPPGPGRGRIERLRFEDVRIWTVEMRGGGRVCCAAGAEKVEACGALLCRWASFLSVMEPVCVVPASAAFSLTLQDAMADEPVPPAHSSCSLRLLKAHELSSIIALCGGKLPVRALRSFLCLCALLSDWFVWLGCQATRRKRP